MLTQTEKLEIAGILAHGKDYDTSEPSPLIKQPSAAMARHTALYGPSRKPAVDMEEGDADAFLATLGEDDEEAAPRWQAHVLPSMRDRASVRAELRSMGFQGGDW